MPQVILIVPRSDERHEAFMVAARRLGDLIGACHLVEFVLPAAHASEHGHANIATEMEARGCRADFIVAAQPALDDDKAARHAFRAALFKTERPLLMLPSSQPAGMFGRNVAIAWRDDPRTLKAVVPAMRLLSEATEVHLLAGARAGSPTPTIPPVLVEHNVPAMLHVLAIGSGPFGELLLSRARELGADLLIMGAQGHTRLREMLLGGVTSYVVAHAELPVLMRH